ncbi:MAG: Fe3+ transporter periplasmic protein [Paenibacillaceae bacterium]|jgi:ABC-type Fe3+ transport system substrate-binding protein|nr:Fe3+ transporter periplasmic protein [Paenibacillaceae bacterium]
MANIQAYHRLDEIVEAYPQTLEVLTTNGFAAKDREELYRKYGASTLLNHALKELNLNKDMLLGLLREKAAEGQEAEEPLPPGQLDFLGTTLCSLRAMFRHSFDDWMCNRRQASGERLDCYIPDSCGNGNLYKDACQAEGIEDFPALVTSCGFGEYFRKDFVERFVNKGYFKAVQREKLHPAFPAAQFLDPEGVYTLYGVYPYVLLVDLIRLGDRPVPKRWSDLLNPVYKNDIISVGNANKVAELLLMTIHKDHGDEGLRQLAPNIKDGWHGSRMARTAGTNSGDGAAIYYIPWNFANFCPRSERTAIVWPEDGAIVNPLFLLVQASRQERVQPVIDFVLGRELGQQSADAYCPVLHSQVDNGLPDGASFKWLGWDYIKAHDIYQLKEHTQHVFMKAWKRQLPVVSSHHQC